jgi:class 3 adenylate cyclase
VIGNPVNVASRLESLTKERDVQLIMSRAVVRMTGWIPPAALTDQVSVRGVAEPVGIIMVKRGRELPADVLAVRAEEKEKEKPAAWTAGFWGRR